MHAARQEKIETGMTGSDSAPLIICFGDSLTAGFQAPTLDNLAGLETPYGAFLQEYLGTAARVAVSGVCGEVTGEMVLRFRRDVLDHRPAVVVILGGTNDLGWNAQPTAIMRNLVKMYESALAAGVQPVPVTVPSLRLAGGFGGAEKERWLDEHIARRLELNRLIQDYAAARHLPVVDLFTATSEPETGLLAERYSNDGIHLTTDGYRLLAMLLYDRVLAARFGGS